MKTYFHILANFRNLCAHEDIVYNHQTEKYISDTQYHYKLDIAMTNGEYIYGKKDLFALMIILKMMLTSSEFTTMIDLIKSEIDKLDESLNTIAVNKVLNAMGIPTNFYDLKNL